MSGAVYSFGRGDAGGLGWKTADDGRAGSPAAISRLLREGGGPARGVAIKQISCGSHHISRWRLKEVVFMVSLLLFWRSCLRVALSCACPRVRARSLRFLSLSLSLHICIPLFPAHTHGPPTNTHTLSHARTHVFVPNSPQGIWGQCRPGHRPRGGRNISCATQGARAGREGEKVPASPSREPALDHSCIAWGSRSEADRDLNGLFFPGPVLGGLRMQKCKRNCSGSFIHYCFHLSCSPLTCAHVLAGAWICCAGLQA